MPPHPNSPGWSDQFGCRWQLLFYKGFLPLLTVIFKLSVDLVDLDRSSLFNCSYWDDTSLLTLFRQVFILGLLCLVGLLPWHWQLHEDNVSGLLCMLSFFFLFLHYFSSRVCTPLLPWQLTRHTCFLLVSLYILSQVLSLPVWIHVPDTCACFLNSRLGKPKDYLQGIVLVNLSLKLSGKSLF